MGKYNKEVWVGIFVFIGLLCVGYLTIHLGELDFIDTNVYTVHAKFTSVSGLREGSEVEMAGVPIGKVSRIEVDPMMALAVVYMSIDTEVPLDDETFASVRTSGLIGDKYILITPGGMDTYLADGDEIINTESAIDIENLISKYIFSGGDD